MKRCANRTAKHKNACRRYRKNFLSEHGYLFCESVNCKNPNDAFPPHSVHHIMSAGRNPSHKHLHDNVNLILLCHKCHTAFEENNRIPEHNKLVEERGLNKLFGKLR